jgi:hypothetical protein
LANVAISIDFFVVPEPSKLNATGGSSLFLARLRMALNLNGVLPTQSRSRVAAAIGGRIRKIQPNAAQLTLAKDRDGSVCLWIGFCHDTAISC